MRKTTISTIHRDLLLMIAEGGKDNLLRIKATLGIKDDSGFVKLVEELRKLGLVQDPVGGASRSRTLKLTEIGRRLLKR